MQNQRAKQPGFNFRGSALTLRWRVKQGVGEIDE